MSSSTLFFMMGRPTYARPAPMRTTTGHRSPERCRPGTIAPDTITPPTWWQQLQSRRDQVQELAVSYAERVVDEEWSLMKEGRSSSRIEAQLEELRRSVQG